MTRLVYILTTAEDTVIVARWKGGPLEPGGRMGCSLWGGAGNGTRRLGSQSANSWSRRGVDMQRGPGRDLNPVRSIIAASIFRRAIPVKPRERRQQGCDNTEQKALLWNKWRCYCALSADDFSSAAPQISFIAVARTEHIIRKKEKTITIRWLVIIKAARPLVIVSGQHVQG